MKIDSFSLYIMRVLFLVPYPHNEAPSQRFRFEQYLEAMKEEGLEVHIKSFLSEKSWSILYSKGKVFPKTWAIAKGILNRWRLIFSIRRYDTVFIHREITPMGMPIIEYLICKRAKYVIYDFDDAIWLPNSSQSNKTFSFLKRHSNTRSLCKWSDAICAGNSYLAEYASQFNSNVVMLPTTIDTEAYHNQLKNHQAISPVVIGWTGSHSTTRYLKDILPALNVLGERNAIEFVVISDMPPELEFDKLKFIKWSKEREIQDLLKIDIGVMPLLDTDWSKGKCGFKALQYMSLGIPTVASPVGVNEEIIEHGVNGYLASSNEDWVNYLTRLIENHELRNKIGTEARESIVRIYSVKANRTKFIHLFPQQNKG